MYSEFLFGGKKEGTVVALIPKSKCALAVNCAESTVFFLMRFSHMLVQNGEIKSDDGAFGTFKTKVCEVWSASTFASISGAIFLVVIRL